MNKLVATSLEGRFHVFDMRTQHPTIGFASVSEKVFQPFLYFNIVGTCVNNITISLEDFIKNVLFPVSYTAGNTLLYFVLYVSKEINTQCVKSLYLYSVKVLFLSCVLM